MLTDKIEFFTNHNLCFIYQTDDADRCRINVNDDFGHFLVSGRTRLWRSISSTTFTYACRLKTFLVFEDPIRHSKNDKEFDQKRYARVDDDEAFYCAILSYSARLETLLLPNEINITIDDDTNSVSCTCGSTKVRFISMSKKQ
jgi:hypothetical protein